MGMNCDMKRGGVRILTWAWRLCGDLPKKLTTSHTVIQWCDRKFIIVLCGIPLLFVPVSWITDTSKILEVLGTKLEIVGHQNGVVGEGFRRCSWIRQALHLRSTDAFRLQPQASARHHWTSRANVADMALLTWFLLWLPTYEDSCCLQLLPSSLSHSSAVWRIHTEPESADRLSSRVSVCISQWSPRWEGCKMLNPSFHLHDVHAYTLRNV